MFFFITETYTCVFFGFSGTMIAFAMIAAVAATGGDGRELKSIALERERWRNCVDEQCAPVTYAIK